MQEQSFGGARQTHGPCRLSTLRYSSSQSHTTTSPLSSPLAASLHHHHQQRTRAAVSDVWQPAPKAGRGVHITYLAMAATLVMGALCQTSSCRSSSIVSVVGDSASTVPRHVPGERHRTWSPSTIRSPQFQLLL